MSAKDDKVNLDRRAFLTGAFQRFRKDDTEEDTAPPRAETSQTYSLLKEANHAFELGDFHGALERYDQYLKAEPKNNEVRMRKGRCLYNMGRYIQAKVEFERVLRLRKEDNESTLHLGLTLARLDKADKASVIWKMYFDPERPVIQRELNLQLLYLETEGMEPPPAREMADAVEAAMAEQRRQDRGNVDA